MKGSRFKELAPRFPVGGTPLLVTLDHAHDTVINIVIRYWFSLTLKGTGDTTNALNNHARVLVRCGQVQTVKPGNI